MRVADGFAGAGGMTEGCVQAGATPVWAGNHWWLAVETHKRNHPEAEHTCQDLHQIDWRTVPEMDLLTASPACVPPDAKIEMSDGRLVRADELKLGDTVLTHRGRGKAITNVWTKTFTGRMVSLRMWGDSKQEVKTTEDHLIWIRRMKTGTYSRTLRAPVFIRADEVRPGDYVAFPRVAEAEGTAAAFVASLLPADTKYSIGETIVPEHERAAYRKPSRYSDLGCLIPATKCKAHTKKAHDRSVPGLKIRLDGNDTELWWLLGHYLGDGQARGDRPSGLGWSVGGSKENLDRVRGTLRKLGLSSWVQGEPSNQTVFASSTHLYAVCVAFGRLCHEKSIPPALLRLEKRFTESLLDGYLDADGSERMIHGNIVHRATSTSLLLLQGLQRLCWNLGWSAAIGLGGYEREGVIEGRPVHCRQSWELVVRKNVHKQSRTKFEDCVWRSVHSVDATEVIDEKVYDFEVEEDHTFCLPGVTVHNCQGHSSCASAVGVGKRGKAPSHDALRATAWAVVSCAEVHRPPVVLVENVPEFVDWVLYPVWKQALEALDYKVATHVFDSAEFGVPQNRKRLFLTGYRGKKALVLESPKKKLVPFEGFLDKDADNWAPVASKPPGVRERVAKGRVTYPTGMFITHYVTGHPGRSLDRPIGTITTKLQWALVKPSRSGDLIRMLSVAEHRRAMGFPETYWLPESRTCDSVKLLGNAVCPPVAKSLVKQIMERA